MIRRLWWSICLAVLASLLPIGAAHADAIDDMAWVMDHVPAGTLPFSGNEVRKYRSLIEQCQAAGNFDQVVGCIDNAAKDPQIGDAAGIPSWFPLMLDIYFDIKKGEYWSLLADAGEAVACVAAQIIAGGLDVCGVIKDLIATAKALAAAAAAVGKFFADLGVAIGSLASGIACAISGLWGGCSKGSGPPPPEALAWQNSYFPRVQNEEGLNKRLASPEVWHGYAGNTWSDGNAWVVGAGVSAGIPKDGMMKSLPAFWKAVYTQWDARISGKVFAQVKLAAAKFSTPSVLDQYVQAGQAAWNPTMAFGGSFGSPVGVAMAALLDPGMSACRQSIEAAGAQQAEDWFNEGRPQATGVQGPPWLSNHMQLCDDFRNQLGVTLANWAGQKALAQTGCTLATDGSNNYLCGAPSTTHPCQNALVTLGQDWHRCKNQGPAPGEKPKVMYVCPPGICKSYALGTAPGACKVMDLNKIKSGEQYCSNYSDGMGTPANAQSVYTPSSNPGVLNTAPGGADSSTSATGMRPVVPAKPAVIAPPAYAPPVSAPPVSTVPSGRPPPMQMAPGAAPLVKPAEDADKTLLAARCTALPNQRGAWQCADRAGLAVCQKLQSEGKIRSCQ
jgi:hypothetical protein